MFLEKDAVLSLKQDDVSSTYYAKYHYLSKNVNNITFYFQYEKDGEIIQDVLGSYEINNHFDIKNIFKGYSADEGKITLKLIDEDTCIYLDCSSNINTSKPKTISKISSPKNSKNNYNQQNKITTTTTTNTTSKKKSTTLKKPNKLIPYPKYKNTNTKFYYYNNYNINQPHYFYKNYQKY